MERNFIVFYKYKLTSSSVQGYIDIKTYDGFFLNERQTIRNIQSTNINASEIIITNIIELDLEDSMEWKRC